MATYIRLMQSYTKASADADPVRGSFVNIKPDTVSCYVTEERNGLFEVKLVYLATGQYKNRFAKGKVLEVTVNQGNDQNVDPLQHFDIYEIEKDEYYITVYARHVFYRLGGFFTPPFKQTGVIEGGSTVYKLWDCMNGAFHETDNFSAGRFTTTGGLFNNSLINFNFNGIIGSSNNVTKDIAYSNTKISDLKTCLLDIINFYDADLCRDNFTVKCGADRGQSRGSIARYGLNVSKFEYTDNSDDAYNRIVAYTYRTDDGVRSIYQYGDYWVYGTRQFSYNIPYLWDVSQILKQVGSNRLNEIISEMRYKVDDHGSLNVRINLADVLNSTEGSSEEFADVHELAICDTVTLDYSPLGISNMSLRVVKTVFDVLKERYETIELGSLVNNFTKMVSEITAIEQSVENNSTYTRLDSASGDASEALTIAGEARTTANAAANTASIANTKASAVFNATTTIEAGSNLDNVVTPGFYDVWANNYAYTYTLDGTTVSTSGAFYGGMIVRQFHNYIIQEITSVSSNSDSYTKYARRRKSNGQWGRWRKQTWDLM